MFDDEPKKKSEAYVVGMDITTFSIDDLEERIEELKTEIDRLEEAVTAKRNSMASAESLFKK